MVEAALAGCREAGLDCGLFSAVKGNPPGANVSDGVAAFATADTRGPPSRRLGLDAVKAVALMVK